MLTGNLEKHSPPKVSCGCHSSKLGPPPPGECHPGGLEDEVRQGRHRHQARLRHTGHGDAGKTNKQTDK